MAIATPAQILRQYLIDVGSLVGQDNPPANSWPSVVGGMPTGQPNNFVALADTGERQFGRAFDGRRMQMPLVQIMVRASKYPDAKGKCTELQATMDKIGASAPDGVGWVPVNVGSESFVIKNVHTTTSAVPLGTEEAGKRLLFSINVQVTIQDVTVEDPARTYPTSAPDADDTFMGYHNGVLSLFPAGTVAAAILPTGGPGVLSRDGGGVLSWVPAASLPDRVIYASEIEGIEPDATFDNTGNFGTDNTQAIMDAIGDEPVDLVIDCPVAIAGTIELPSGSRIRGLTKCPENGLYKLGVDDGSNGWAVITNKHPVAGPTFPEDGYLAVEDLWVNGGRRCFASGNDGSVPALAGNYERHIANLNGEIVPCIAFFGANRVVVRDVEVHDSVSYGLWLANVRSYSIKGFSKWQQDGDLLTGNDILHINGHCYDGDVEDVAGVCNDDALALAPNDGNDIPGATLTFRAGTVAAGPIRKLSVRGLKATCFTGVRFLSAAAANDITGIDLDDLDITLGHSGFAPFLWDTFNVPGDGSQGWCDKIRIGKVRVQMLDGTTAGEYATFHFFRCNFGLIEIENVVSTNDYGTVRLLPNAIGGRLRLHNVTSKQLSVPPIQIQSADIGAVEITDPHWDAPGPAGNPSYPRNTFCDVIAPIGSLTILGGKITGHADSVVLFTGAAPGSLLVGDVEFETDRGGNNAVVVSDVPFSNYVVHDCIAEAETYMPASATPPTLLLADTFSGDPDNASKNVGDTTGATLITVAVSSYGGATAPDLSDSYGNGWTLRETRIGASTERINLYECANPVCGPDHTIETAGTGTYASLGVVVLTGDLSYAESNGNVGVGAGMTAGSVAGGSVIVTAIGSDGAGVSAINSGFNKDGQEQFASGNNFGVSIAHLFQTSPATVNPTWTGGPFTSAPAVIVVYNAAVAGPERVIRSIELTRITTPSEVEVQGPLSATMLTVDQNTLADTGLILRSGGIIRVGNGGAFNFDGNNLSVGNTISASVMQASSAPSDDIDLTNKLYVDERISAAVTSLLEFKGTINASGNPNYPAAEAGDSYVVSVAGKVGGASGTVVEAGDVVLAIANNAGGTEAAVGASWDTIQHNLTGVLLSANNLSDVANAATARTNIGLGTGNSPTFTGLTLSATLVSTAQIQSTGNFISQGRLGLGTAAIAGTFDVMLSDNSGFVYANGFHHRYTSNANAGAGGSDVGHKRLSAGVLGFTDGASGNGAISAGMPAIGTPALSLQAIASATANLFELKRSGGGATAHTRFTKEGNLIIGGDGIAYTENTLLSIQQPNGSEIFGVTVFGVSFLSTTTGGLTVTTTNDNIVPATIYGGSSFFQNTASLQVNMGCRGGTPGASTAGIVVRWKEATGGTGDLIRLTGASDVLQHRYNAAGYWITSKNAAPADADLLAGECSFWFDKTNGAAKLMVKGKQADGTVRTASVAMA